MTLTQLEKLYPKLSPTEQGNLAFESIVRRDDAELEAIKGSVNKVNYSIPEVGFRERLSFLIELSLLFGLYYWKTNAMMLRANQEKQSESQSLFSEMAALDAALIEVCNQLRVDIASVRRLAGCENEPSLAEYATPEQTVSLIENLMMTFR